MEIDKTALSLQQIKVGQHKIHRNLSFEEQMLAAVSVAVLLEYIIYHFICMR